MERQKYTISTNKLLYEIFNFTYSDDDIKEGVSYTKENEKEIYYYIEFSYEEFKGNTSKVKISSLKKENLRFTIEEMLLYLILIDNAKNSNVPDDYFISFRKIRNIRGLKSNSLNTYKKYESAIERLISKTIMVTPIRSTCQRTFLKSPLLEIKNQQNSKNRIKEFTYSFGKLDNTFIKSKQQVRVSYNPYSFILKQSFAFQLCLHLTRLVFLNKSGKHNSKNFSFQNILMGIQKVDTSGLIESTNYYQYISSAGNKQSEILRNCYCDLEYILSMMKETNYIIDYSIPVKRSYMYLKDNEVKITIKFLTSSK